MTPEIRQRISEIQSGTVPEGYVKTRAGIMPADWTAKPLYEMVDVISEQAGNRHFETLSISAGKGFVNQARKFGKELSGKQYSKYIVLHRGDFSYNKGNSNKYPQGCVYRLEDREVAAVPNVFESFRITVGNPDFYNQLFISGFLNRQLFSRINHGVRDDGLLNLSEDDFYSCAVVCPSLPEQQKISEILTTQDQLIALQQSKLDELKKLKKACLDKMFPKNGSDVPEVRFPGFTGAWEQRKLGEVVDVRGGMDYKHLQEGEIPVYGTGGYMLSVNEALSYTEDAIGIGRKGTIDKPYILKAPFWTVDTLFYAVPRNKFDLNFVFDIFQNVDWKKKDESTGVPSLSKTTINDVDVLVPSLHEQQQIGTFFATLDELISLHQHKLDEMKRLKKGLMQVLLMGIVRVDEGKESEV